uniref:VWFA domain-containing protein n=1 Tax=Pygocentrus nattereri TaxID=42514 RepID=A0AAR2J269_PYGNA
HNQWLTKYFFSHCIFSSDTDTISASEYLFQALDKLLFFKEVKILVPPNWSGTYVRTRKETYDKGPNVANLSLTTHTQHMVMNKQIKGCGEESEYIHFTPNFLLNDDLLNAYGPRGRIFVHEWAHLRWVVFDEYNESHSTCLTTMSRKQGQLVTTFCQTGEHNAETKNIMIQRQHRVICLILDVSGSICFAEIVEDGAYVGIVKFSSKADIVSPLTKIEGKYSRHSLINNLPTTTGGTTKMCKGLALGSEKNDESVEGDDVIFLTDAEATDDINSCLQSTVDSGAIISTAALGPEASDVLVTMVDLTGMIGSPQQIICLHLALSTASSTFTPTISMSTFTTSINVL